ncbi:MAG: LysM peptidoglycan-binding domain-containing protein [Candidatus Aenigmarchaeota archaeon]|nr:LysM peptidoglycan-binding domain-containing protein [Candidatus Aenigmarchaeota archaeon]
MLPEELKSSNISGRKKAISGAIAGLTAAAIGLVYTGFLAPDYSNVQKAEPVRIVEQQKADYFQQALHNLPAKVQVPETIYTVKKGDCLSQIALEHYGNGSKKTYMQLAERNGIKDPDFIVPGQKLKL